MTPKEIVSLLPYLPPFLFVDELIEIDDDSVTGIYTYQPSLDFYKGHFKNNPITPGVILTETMAQIGLACLALYILRDDPTAAQKNVAMTSAAVEFLKPVYPGETVTVISEKVYFRFNKLKCNIRMQNSAKEIVCSGTISGIIFKKSNAS